MMAIEVKPGMIFEMRSKWQLQFYERYVKIISVDYNAYSRNGKRNSPMVHGIKSDDIRSFIPSRFGLNYTEEHFDQRRYKFVKMCEKYAIRETLKKLELA